VPPLSDIAKDQDDPQETPLGVADGRPAIINRAFSAVSGKEQGPVGEADHCPLPEHPGDGILDHLPGILLDNREHLGNVPAQHRRFGPPGECRRRGVEKHDLALAVGRDDRIPHTGQGRTKPLMACVRRRELHRATPSLLW
jgi:hypothetical protein